MAQPPEAEPSDTHREPDEILRAKYLDYCSAQVAEILLRMSPDEMFVMAQEARAARGGEGTLSYDAMVQLATGRIFRELDLPPFRTWVALYKEDPARFESEILGFWDLEPRVSGSRP